MRCFRPLAAALALVFLVGSATPARAETLVDLAKRLGELRKRVGLWNHLITQDRDRDRIILYGKQTEEDFKKKDPGLVTAQELVAIIANRDKEDRSIRTDAGKALVEAAKMAHDPDLAPRTKRVMSRRAEFALKHLIPWVAEPDKKGGNRWTRLIIQDVLKSWFAASGGNLAAIAQYDVDKESTWKKAEQAWRDVLKDS